MFEVGDKVVCIDDKNQHDGQEQPDEMDVEEGKVYVVRNIDSSSPEEGMGLFLVGMFAGWFDLWENAIERSYMAKRFRKLSDIQAENKAKRQAKKGVSGRLGAKGFSHQDA